MSVNIKKYETLEDEVKTILFCTYRMEELKKIGIVEGGNHSITDSGQEVYKHMLDINFLPDLTTAKKFISEYMGHCEENITDFIYETICDTDRFIDAMNFKGKK